MDALQAIRTRRTVRRFQDRPPGRDALAALLDAAVRAPNHRRSEPWRFYVLDRAALDRLADALAAPLRARGADAATMEKFRADLAPAPLAVAVTCRTSPSPRRRREDYAATCAAIENMLLAAVALGLGGYWRTGRLVEDEAVRSFLGVPREEEVVAFVYFGYPAAPGEPAPRTPWQEKTVWL